MPAQHLSLPPSIEDFEALASRAFAALPPEVRHACGGLALRVTDFAPDEMLDEMGIEDPFELTGLYDGIALTER
jgi:predicted Zn-dependent protease with MMP-like domain